jgi:hypothetical protein
VEDSLHKQFIYRYLKKIGVEAHAMRIYPSPAGSGSAEQWVRERFAIEVEACRRRKAETKLIIVIDADTRTVQQRISQLDQALSQAGIEPISDDTETISRLIPKRNIETWILCLNEVPVNESDNYKEKHQNWTSLTTPAVTKLYAWTRPNAIVPTACVESLKAGIRELKKLRL